MISMLLATPPTTATIEAVAICVELREVICAAETLAVGVALCDWLGETALAASEAVDEAALDGVELALCICVSVGVPVLLCVDMPDGVETLLRVTVAEGVTVGDPLPEMLELCVWLGVATCVRVPEMRWLAVALPVILGVRVRLGVQLGEGVCEPVPDDVSDRDGV
jgi:hypothetical protein